MKGNKTNKIIISKIISIIRLLVLKVKEANTRKIISRFHELSFTEAKRQQKKELFRTLDYAIRNIDYYKNIAIKSKFRYSEETIFKDIRNFPVLTKKDIRENLNALVNQNYLDDSVKNCSGGTTGEPVKIFQHSKNLYLSHIMTKIQYENLGYDERKDIFIQLWGDEKEIIKNYRNNQDDGITKVSKNHYILNTFVMSNTHMARYCKFINENPPVLIVSYVQSLYELAKYIKSNGIKIVSPKIIITSAGVLHPYQRELIEDTFLCRVNNRYGSREVHCIGIDCKETNGFHLESFMHYTEILDESLETIKKDGAQGEIYVTLFFNPVMPLIRYKMGDIGTYTNKRCLCGSNEQLLKALKGRTVDVFTNYKGDRIDGEYFTHLFYLRESIKKFQIIQESSDLININICREENISKKKYENDILEIIKGIRILMGKKCRIKIAVVNDIPSSSSGKFRYTISKVK